MGFKFEGSSQYRAQMGQISKYSLLAIAAVMSSLGKCEMRCILSRGDTDPATQLSNDPVRCLVACRENDTSCGCLPSRR